MEPTKKVFCSKCKHFMPDPSTCNSASNPKHYYSDWYQEDLVGMAPWVVNKHNSCSWYETKD